MLNQTNRWTDQKNANIAEITQTICRITPTHSGPNLAGIQVSYVDRHIGFPCCCTICPYDLCVMLTMVRVPCFFIVDHGQYWCARLMANHGTLLEMTLKNSKLSVCW